MQESGSLKVPVPDLQTLVGKWDVLTDLLNVGPALQEQHGELHMTPAGGQGQRGLEAVRRHVHLNTAKIS
jgi:hypothetical protein